MAPSLISDPTVAIESYLSNHNKEFLKSQTDLSLNIIDDDPELNVHEVLARATPSRSYALPIELFNDIIEKNYFSSDAESITSLLDEFSKSIPLVNKLFNRLARKLLYRYCVFTRPNSFFQFLQNLISDPSLGLYVKSLDFMEFTSIGLGRTGKMNQEIQMVTDTTILDCLKRTPYLVEFLASESIDTDIDLEILNCLFNELSYLQSIDFCGATNSRFVELFNELNIDTDRVVENQIAKLSFHDCTNLSPDVFAKILPHLKHLRRLDLSHTLISLKILNEKLPQEARLTHLSLLRCTNLTTRDLMEFLIHHEAVKNDTLKWLNLQVDSSNVSTFNKDQLTVLLKNINASDVEYLNLGGLPVAEIHLQIILNKFPHLKSLGISNSQLTLQEIVDFLTKSTSALKLLDLSGCKAINKWTVEQPVLLNASSSLMLIEISNKLIDDLPNHLMTPLSIWKPFDNNRSSRRSWIYKVDESERKKILKDPSYNSDMINNLVFYDMQTGKKIKKTVKPPAFLKYTSKKINCSNGFYNYSEDHVFPVEYSERGIYKYYSLNK